ncbi:MAG: DUF427 domain-containing protein [Pseudomonadota bacterium]
MAEITIRAAPGTWVVRTGDAVLGETTAALELFEGDLKPVVYFPRGDIAMAFLEPSDHRTTCPWKGEAAHFHISTPEGMIENAAWSYETPIEGVARIKGHIAFYASKATVEQL